MRKLFASDKADNKEESGVGQIYRGIFDFLEVFVYAFVFVIIIITFLIRHSPVEGTSMEPTLEENDLILVTPIGLEGIKTGDIIVFQSQALGYEKPLVKRVIATAGQKLYIDHDKWEVYVDDVLLDESYLSSTQKSSGASMTSYSNKGNYDFPIVIPDGYVFVMGDNRTVSLDSRDTSLVGLVDTRSIFGKVVFRLLPFDKIGAVEK